MNRLSLWYDRILKKDFVYKLNSESFFEISQLKKIIVNASTNEAISDSKQLLPVITAVEIITNQKPALYYSKKSIAAFKLRKNLLIGCHVILQKKYMFDFLDLFIFFVLPKIQGFKGFKTIDTSFVTNISIGLPDIFIFHQLGNNMNRFSKRFGCTITFVIQAKTNSLKNVTLTSFQIPRNK